jgi:carbonic anhydrase/acetyltransferase-like protein (isoleucine patch superfamily)
MIKSFDGKTPRIAPSAFVQETAYIIGDVEIGEYSNVWPGAVIRGDSAKITIGKNTSIQDCCVVHAEEDMVIGDNVILGHSSMIHCKEIGNNVIVGNNATVLDGVEIGNYCIIAAGATVAPNMNIPDSSLVMGVPAKRKGEISAEHHALLKHNVQAYIKLGQKYKQQGL